MHIQMHIQVPRFSALYWILDTDTNIDTDTDTHTDTYSHSSDHKELARDTITGTYKYTYSGSAIPRSSKPVRGGIKAH